MVKFFYFGEQSFIGFRRTLREQCPKADNIVNVLQILIIYDTGVYARFSREIQIKVLHENKVIFRFQGNYKTSNQRD